jgi:hypothetical protein
LLGENEKIHNDWIKSQNPQKIDNRNKDINLGSHELKNDSYSDIRSSRSEADTPYIHNESKEYQEFSNTGYNEDLGFNISLFKQEIEAIDKNPSFKEGYLKLYEKRGFEPSLIDMEQLKETIDNSTDAQIKEYKDLLERAPKLTPNLEYQLDYINDKLSKPTKNDTNTTSNIPPSNSGTQVTEPIIKESEGQDKEKAKAGSVNEFQYVIDKANKGGVSAKGSGTKKVNLSDKEAAILNKTIEKLEAKVVENNGASFNEKEPINVNYEKINGKEQKINIYNVDGYEIKYKYNSGESFTEIKTPQGDFIIVQKQFGKTEVAYLGNQKETPKAELKDLGVFDEDLETEISNYKLDTPQGLNKYKNQLSNTKRNLTTFEKEPTKFSSQISLAKETIKQQETVLKYFENKAVNQPLKETPKVEIKKVEAEPKENIDPERLRQIELLDTEKKIAQLEKEIRRAPVRGSKGQLSQRQLRTQLKNYKEQLRELKGLKPRKKVTDSVLRISMRNFSTAVKDEALSLDERLIMSAMGNLDANDKDIRTLDGNANLRRQGALLKQGGSSIDQIVTDFINENDLDSDMAQDFRDTLIDFVQRGDAYEWMNRIKEREATPDPDEIMENEFYDFVYNEAIENDLTDEEISEIELQIIKDNELTQQEYETIRNEFIDNGTEEGISEDKNEADTSKEEDEKRKSVLEAKVKGAAEIELDKQIEAAKNRLIEAQRELKKKEKELWAKTAGDIFGRPKLEGAFFEDELSFEVYKKTIKPYKDAITFAQNKLNELEDPKRRENAVEFDKKQNKLDLEAEPTEATIVKDPILKRLNKAFLKIGAEILDNAEQLAAKAKELVSGGAKIDFSMEQAISQSKNVKLEYNSNGKHLAPNGKPSNLTEQQAKIVRTPAFKKWFGDWDNDPKNASKIVDKNGEPMVVYHGTGSTLTEFDKNTRGSYTGASSAEKGFFVSDTKSIAESYRRAVQVENPNLEGLKTILSKLSIEELKQFGKGVIGYDIRLFDRGDYTKEEIEYELFRDIENDSEGYYADRRKLIEKASKYLKENEIDFSPYENTGMLIEGFLNIRNPKKIDADSQTAFDIDLPKIIDNSISENKDGVWVENVYDSVSFDEKGNDTEEGSIMVFFEPNQIKLADGTNTTFDSKVNDFRYNITLPDGSQKQVKAIDVDVVNGFYSPLEKVISEAKQDKMPAKQWAEKFAKGEEAKWTGLQDWLNTRILEESGKSGRLQLYKNGENYDAQWTGGEKRIVKTFSNEKDAKEFLYTYKGGITKTDIQNFLKENRIQVVEVVKGGENGKDYSGRKQEIEQELERNGYSLELDMGGDGYMLIDKDGELADYETIPEDIQNIHEEYNEISDSGFNESSKLTSGDTKFGQYQLEGEKENYKEVLVTMPPKEIKGEPYHIVRDKYLLPALRRIGLERSENALRRMKAYDEDGRAKEFESDSDFPKAIEALNKLKSAGEQDALNKYYDGFKVNSLIDDQRKKTFKSSHFDEPNILVHLRMNTRVDAEGNKVLFLEEVQSDWGQQGKKQGFQSRIDYTELAKEASKKEGVEITKGEIEQMVVSAKNNWTSGTKDQVYLRELFGKERADEIIANHRPEGTPTAPFVTDTNAWTKLGLKVALKEAVKQGADKIAWTTGEQQNDRYDLSKQVDEIQYFKNSNDTYNVYARKGGQTIESKSNLNEKDLENMLGKDVAQRIIKNEGLNIEVPAFGKYEPAKSLKGEQLSVGGKGMKGFYGNPSEGTLGIVGNVAKSLFKQEPKTVKLNEGKDEKLKAYQYDGTQDVLGMAGVDYLKKGDWIVELPSGFKMIVGANSKEEAIREFKEAADDTESSTGEFSESTQHSIDITPELAATVEQGQPLFHLNDKGEILGFTFNGKIYLNGEKITAKTTMEEAGHIWINWAKENRSDLYQQGLEKIQGSKYLIEVNNNPSYQAEALKQGEKGSDAYNAYMQEEALAKAIADNGAKFITETRKASFREWVNAMWKEVAKAFGIQKLKPSEVKALTLEEFAKMAAADVFSNKEVAPQEQVVDKANPQIAEAIEATLRGEMNADDAAISLDEKGIEVTNEIYDSLRDAEKQFQKEKAGIQVGDIVMVKGRNGNPDFEANFRGLDKNGKYIVYNTESGTTFSVTKGEIITPMSKEAELADLKEQLKKAKLTATKNEIQAKIDALEGNEPKAPKGPSDGLGSRAAANTNNITPTQNAERVSMKFHLELKKLIESIGVPIAERNLSKRFLGIFKHRSMNIRVQSLFGVATAAHETAHWVSKKFGIGEALRDKSAIVAANPDAQLNKALRKALTEIYIEFYPNAKKEHRLYLRVEEGIAVLLEHYLTDPTDISNRYGILVDNFIAPTGKYYHPKFTELLEKLNKFLGEYSALTDNEKIGSRIVSGEEVTKKNEGFTPAQSIVNGWVNSGEPLRRADNIADAGLTQESAEVAHLRWLSRAGIIAPWITGEKHALTLDRNGNWKEVGASVKDYLELIKGREIEFNEYLVARRNLGDVNYLTEMENELADILADIENEEDLTKEEVEEINKLSARIQKQREVIVNDKFDIQQSTATVGMFEEEFKKAVAIYDKLNNAVVDFAQKSGLISSEKAEAYKANTTYTAFKRLIMDDISGESLSGGSSSQSQVGAFKTRTGSDLQIIDPVYSQIQFISETLNKGMQNMIWQRLAALSDENVELARRFEKVPTVRVHDPITGAVSYPQMREPGKQVVKNNGVPSFYLAAPEYIALAETLTPKELETMAYVLTKASGLFSRLTTSANPLFPFVNVPIDTISAWMNTKTGFIPGWSQMRVIPQMASYAKDKAAYSVKNLANRAIDILHNMVIIGDWFKGIKNIPIKDLTLEEQNLFAKYLALGGSTQTLSAYQNMSPEEMIKAITGQSKFKKVFNKIIDLPLSILEMPSNASEYMTRFAEFKRAKEQGYSDDVAMYMAAHVSVPFIQSGTYGGQFGKTTVKAIPYFHSSIQVLAKFAQTAKNNPTRTATIGAALIAIKISQTLLTMALSDDEDKEMLAEQEPSELAKYIYVPNKLFGGKGFTRIRFGNEFGSISAPIEMMILQNKGLANYNFKDYLDATTTAVPQQFNLFKPVEAIWSYTPQIVRPSLEVGFNVKTYPNVRPIVPYGISFKSPMNQYNQYTTETSKYLGQLVGLSPMKIDYFVKAQFGKVPDMLLRNVEEIAFDKKNKSRSQIFLQEEQYVLSGRNYVDFYEKNKYWEQLYNDIRTSKNSGVELTNKQLEIIQNHKIFDATSNILSELRDRVNKGEELSRETKHAAFELLKELNSSDKPYTLVNEYTNLINQLSK